MKRIIISTLIFLVAYSQLSAQAVGKEYQKHEFSVGVLGGVHALKYDMSVGESSNKFSGGIGVGYTYFFKKNMGLATGLDLTFYNAEVELNDFSGNHEALAIDIDLPREFMFSYVLNNYKEKQTALFINIPIMFHYQFTDGDNVKFYAAAGGKIGIPASGKYKSSGASLTTQGYFPHDNSTLYGPKFRGFGDFVTKQYDNELNYKMAFSLAIEAGAKWTLPNNMALYTGVYLDYGLNDVKKSQKSDVSLVQYNQISPEDHIFGGVANSSFKPESGALSSMVDKINTMAYGVKIRLAFGK